MVVQSVKATGGDAEKRKRRRRRSGRRRKHRTSVTSLSGSAPLDMMATAHCVVSEEGIDSGKDGEVCFGCLFMDLQKLKEDTGNLRISISHPYFVFITDKLLAVGVEKILKKRWEHQLESLNDFVVKYGDCLVPIEHPSLGDWVRVQHGHYKQYKNRLPSQLTKERFMKLEAIVGFDELEIEGKEDGSKEADQGCFGPEPLTVCFGGVFAELQKFKEDKGNLTIAKSHPSFVSIMDKFSAAGMEEILKKRWENQLDSLKDFADKYGDCSVPIEHPSLGEWVRVQRHHYGLFKKRLPSPLTKERFSKLKEIVGFDELSSEKFKEAKKNGNNSVFDTGLEIEESPSAPDKKISLTTGINKVRLGGNTAKDFSTSKALPAKEETVAELHENRAKGAAHRSAVHRGETFSATRGDKDEPNRRATDNHLSGPTPAEALKNKPIRRATDNYLGRSMPAGALNNTPSGPSKHLSASIPPKIQKPSTFEERLRRKLHGESIEEIYKEKKQSLTVDDLGKHSSLVSKSLANNFTTGHKELTVGANKDKPNRRAKDNYLSAATPTEAPKNKPIRRATDNYLARSMPAGALNKPSGPSNDMHLSASIPPKTLKLGTFEERLQRKMRGESIEKIYKKKKQFSTENDLEKHSSLVPKSLANNATTNRKELTVSANKDKPNRRATDNHLSAPTHAKALENKPNRRATDNYLGRSMPAGALNNRPSGPSKDMHLSASMPPKTLKLSTFEERLQRKLHGEDMEEIYKEKRQSLSVDDLISGASLAAEDSDDSDSVDSWGSLCDELDNDHASDWRSKLNSTGLKSKDDIALENWSDMHASHSENKFSRWKLLFKLRRYDSKEEQLNGVSSVLNTIIYADKWDILPYDNGDIAMKMTTQTLDEHKTVEMYVQELGNLHSRLRSDFYFH